MSPFLSLLPQNSVCFQAVCAWLIVYTNSWTRYCYVTNCWFSIPAA